MTEGPYWRDRGVSPRAFKADRGMDRGYTQNITLMERARRYISNAGQGGVERGGLMVVPPIDRSGEETVQKGMEAARNALSDCNVLVVGFGRTGRSAARFLRRCGANVTVTDRGPEDSFEGVEEFRELNVDFELGVEEPSDECMESTNILLVSPGVPLSTTFIQEARERGLQVMGDIELASRFISVPVVAVTGTNGKTTTTELIGAILKGSDRDVFVGGNIGTPVFDYFEEGSSYEAALLEVSSYQLESVERFKPAVGVLLNVTDDHMDRYPSFKEYGETKLKIFGRQGEGDTALINIGDPFIERLYKASRSEAGGGLLKKIKGKGTKAGTVPEGAFFGGHTVPFSATGEKVKGGIYLRGTEIVYGKESYPTEGLPLKGRHNIENMMAAIGTARAMGIESDSILEVLRGFQGLPHRMEFVKSYAGVDYINDSKSTNVGSLKAALDSMATEPEEGEEGGKRLILIAGGMAKDGDFAPLEGVVRERVKVLILIGEDRTKLALEMGGGTETVTCRTMREAVREAKRYASEGDRVLLSPGCASFDMYNDYRDRGDEFKRIVVELTEG